MQKILDLNIYFNIMDFCIILSIPFYKYINCYSCWIFR